MAGDIGWLSFSTDDGKSWPAPERVTPDTDKAVHIVQVLGGPATRLALSWGSAVSGNSNSEIYAAVVTLTAAR